MLYLARILSVSILLPFMFLQAAFAADLPAGAIPVGETANKREVADSAGFRRITSLQVTEDTTLSGNLLVEGFITVSPQATLSILPGSVLRFSADSGIFVFGRIAVAGTADAPVRLSSVYLVAASSDWAGITLAGTEKKNVFEHVVFQGATTAVNSSFSTFSARNLTIENVETALKLVDSTALVKDAFFSFASTGISAFKSELDLERAAFEKSRDGLVISASSLSATDLTFAANSITGFTAENSRFKLEKGLFLSNLTGAKISDSEGSIVNSRFRNNSEAGVVMATSAVRFMANVVAGGGIGVKLADNFSALWGNSLSENSHYNLLYLGNDKFNAGGNWFGSSNEADVQKGIYSKQPGALSIKPLLAADPMANQEIQQIRKRR